MGGEGADGGNGGGDGAVEIEGQVDGGAKELDNIERGAQGTQTTIKLVQHLPTTKHPQYEPTLPNDNNPPNPPIILAPHNPPSNPAIQELTNYPK